MKLTKFGKFTFLSALIGSILGVIITDIMIYITDRSFDAICELTSLMPLVVALGIIPSCIIIYITEKRRWNKGVCQECGYIWRKYETSDKLYYICNCTAYIPRIIPKQGD